MIILRGGSDERERREFKERKIAIAILFFVFAFTFASCSNVILPIGWLPGSDSSPSKPETTPHNHDWQVSHYSEEFDGIYVHYICSECGETSKELFSENSEYIADSTAIDSVTNWNDSVFIADSQEVAQKILDSIGNGATLFLRAGNYKNFVLKNTDGATSPKELSGIAIIGAEGASIAQADTTTNDYGYAIDIKAGNSGVSISKGSYEYGLLISGLEFTGKGILMSTGKNQTNTYSDIVIKDCTFKGRDNTDATHCGIRFYVQDRGTDSIWNDITVENCNFSSYGSGVLIFQSKGFTGKNNTIEKCSIGFNFAGGYHLGRIEFSNNTDRDCDSYETWGGNAYVIQGLQGGASVVMIDNKVINHVKNTVVYIANTKGNASFSASGNVYYAEETAESTPMAELENLDLSMAVSNSEYFGYRKDGTIELPDSGVISPSEL